jgi:hypothetical protein
MKNAFGIEESEELNAFGIKEPKLNAFGISEESYSRSTETMGGGQPRQEVVGQRTISPQLFNKDVKDKKSTLELLFPDQENAQKVWNEISKLKGKEKLAAINRVEGLQGVGGLDPFDPVNLAFILTGAGKAIVSAGKKLPGALAEYATNTVEKETANYPFKGKLAEYLSKEKVPFKLNEIPEVKSEFILPKGEPSVLGKKELGQITAQETKYPVTKEGLDLSVNTGTEDLVAKGINREQIINKIVRENPNMSQVERAKLIKDTIEGKVEELPKYAGSINLERQDISYAAKKMELNLFEKEGTKTSVTNKEMINKAEVAFKRLQDDPVYYKERIDYIKKGGTPSVPEEMAFRALNAKKQDEFILATNNLVEGKITSEEFKIIEDSIKESQLKIVDPLAAEAGRRLQSYNIEVGRNQAFKAISKLKKSMNERQVKEFDELVKNGLDDPNKVVEFVKRLPDPKFKEYFYEYWYNSILSGIPTHLVNIGTNTLWLTAQLPHRALVGGVDKLISAFTGKEREYFVREVIPMFAGIKSGAKKGAEGALEVMKTGRSTNWNSKYGVEMGHDIMSAFERSPNAALRKIAPVVSAPVRGLQMMDIQFKGLAFDMYAQSLAKRASLKQGLEGEVAKQFEKEFLKKMPKEAIDEAAKFADYSTFQDAPGKITQLFTKMRDAIPGGRIIVPFIQTVSNITKRGIEMVPIVGTSLARGQKPAEVIAKQLEGAIITYVIADKLESGEITGGWPENPSERDAWTRQGKQPWSIKIGDQWVQYRRVEPFNTVISTVESFYRNFIKNPDDKTIPEQFLNATKGMVDNLIDSSMLDGIRSLLDKNRWEGMAQRQVTSLIPYSGLLRSTSRAFEAIVEGEVLLRNTKDFRGAVSQTLPGLYGEQEPRLNVWGEEIKVEGNSFRQWLPYKWAEATDDPVENELERLKVYPGLPGKKGEIGDVKYQLDDDEYKAYIQMSGKYGHMLIQKIMDSPAYENMDDKFKIKLIDKAYTKTKLMALRYAKNQKLLTPEFMDKFISEYSK